MVSLQSERLRDRLIGALIGLARAADGSEHLITPSVTKVIVEGLAATDEAELEALIRRAEFEKRQMVPNCFTCAMPCGRTSDYDMRKLHTAEEDVRELKSVILRGIRNLAAKEVCDISVERFFYKALFAIGMDDWGTKELQPIIMEMDEVNRKCMALLDKAK